MYRFFLRLGIAPVCALSAAVLLPLAFSANSTVAQELKPVADNTLGAESSFVTPTSPQADRIDGGAIRGANLFHSFSQFDIGEGREAYFAKPSGIENILSRVTGSETSRIFGKLGVLGDANLFLINPNGIIFGRNASLDVRGSFVGTTANAIGFGDRGFFSATNPNTPSLLTINPSAFFFNQIAAALIQNDSVAPARTDAGLNAFGLRVPDGKSLVLVGGNVNMDGGRLNANGGRVELGGLGEPGTVGLGVDGNNLSLRFPENVARADVSFTNQAGIYVEGAGGGDIAINARNLEILGRSVLSAGIRQGLGTPETVAGDITLNATGEIKVAGESIVRNLVRLGSLGNGGNVTIDSGSFSLRDGALLAASTFGVGNAGTIKLNTTDFVTISGKSANFTSGLRVNSQSPTGTAGDIIVTAPRVTLDNSGTLDAQSASGNGGNINLNVRDLLLLRRGAQISTTAGTAQAGGDGGKITINTPSGFIVAVPRENSDITANAFTGRGGQVEINAQSIFGIQPRSQLTPQSDITASSDFGVSGTLEINTPDTDPSRGLVPLAVDVVDVAGFVDDNICAQTANSSFTYTGRGGLPNSPNNTLNSDAVWEDWRLTAIPRGREGERERGREGEKSQNPNFVNTPAS